MSKKEDFLSWERVAAPPKREHSNVIPFPTSENHVESTVATWTIGDNKPGQPSVTIRQVSSGFGGLKPQAILSSQGMAA